MIVFLFSCERLETVVDVSIPAEYPMLVFNGLLDTDTNVRVLISHSVGAFSSESPSCVTDAVALLYQNQQFVDTLSVDLSDTVYMYISSGDWFDWTFDSIPMVYYTSDFIPTAGFTYEIIVNHSEYDNVSASTYIPQDVLIYNIDIDTTSNSSGFTGLTFSFLDDPVQQNYYRLNMFANCSKEWYDYEFGYKENIYMMSNDPSFPTGFFPDMGYTFSGDRVVFTDDLFDGQEKTVLIDLFFYESDINDCDTIIMKFANFSTETYAYYNSLGDHMEKGELNFFGGEVVPVFSNVQNGLGVLISVNSQDQLLKPL